MSAVGVAIVALELSMRVQAAETPQELVGPMTPSIHVPPVRSGPPARTRPIHRPPQYDPAVAAQKSELSYQMECLRLAIEDLIDTFGDRYPRGDEFLRRWKEVSHRVSDKSPDTAANFARLRNDAMLANPLLDFDRLLVLKRVKGQLGLPTNHQCNTCLEQKNYGNELAVLSPVGPGGRLETLYRPDDGSFVGEVDLHFSAQRLLCTMPNGRTWQIHELGIDGGNPRQVSREIDDVDHFDPCYLPDGRIVFASTASFTGVPCWHGRQRACCLYRMDADGANMVQLCYDQDLDLHPSVLSNGQVIYSRWDYTGLLHAYVRPLMVMNPDGSGQRAVYGSNCYYPNCLFFPRAVPGDPNKIVATLSGYHGKNRMGELAVLDISRGWSEAAGILHRITHRGEPVVPVALDQLTREASPQFLHPWPLSDKYILTAMQPNNKAAWGIYLVDVFDNITPVLTDPRHDFFEPLPIKPRPTPPMLPDRTDRSKDNAVVILHDIYQGTGLAGVPRGTIKRLRIGAYHFGYPGMAGPDKIGRGGPWEVMRIIGTVPVYEDGSAKFRVPASTPITLQALDAEGKAVQIMRSWYTAMPGETASCVGCHETPRETPLVRNDLAAARPIAEIEPWYGAARGFDFAREVQPVLDRYCVGCHDGSDGDGRSPLPDLRDERFAGRYQGLPLTMLGATRLDPSLLRRFPERFVPCAGMPKPYGALRTLYTPAYEALIPFVRRVNVEDAASRLNPGEYHADTSELIQLLMKGHYGVELDEEAWDRLVTWIDLNGPCHGTWGDVAEIPGRVDRRRHELAVRTGGPKVDPEIVDAVKQDAPAVTAVVPVPAGPTSDERQEAISRLLDESPQTARWNRQTMTLDLGKAAAIELVRVPAGRFVMGDCDGSGLADEWPASSVEVSESFWIGATEITNEQFRRFQPGHCSGVFTKRQIDLDGPGIQLDDPAQPAVRVSWNEAMDFCLWLSEKSGRRVTLPTESQWEYAARAGSSTALAYGGVHVDFSGWANMADRSLACIYEGTAGVAVLQPFPAEMRFDDLAIGTADVASYGTNVWGLHDTHGNAAEWTRSMWRAYPYDPGDGRNDTGPLPRDEKRVVRGGSYCDRPQRCRSAFRLAYPAWQRVHNVGFRIAVEDGQAGGK